MKKLCLLFSILLTLAGCAPKGEMLVPDSEADTRWQVFQQRIHQPLSYDILSGSLRFGPVNDTRRVTYTLWSGPSEDGSGHSIRLEVNAGVGANVAKVLFAQGRMLLVLPQEGRAYEGLESKENLYKIIGLSLPMRMEDLNNFLAGGILPALDASVPERYQSGGNGNIIYDVIMNGRRCELELNDQALPVRWVVPGHWTLTARYDDKGRPDKLEGTMYSTQGEQRMVLLVKDRRPDSGMPASSLKLEVPQNIVIYALDY